jgi:formylglycine-generating enzyme required for sulfatase activity
MPYAAPVGTVSNDRSWCGILDLTGNVREWCLDGWKRDFSAVEDGAVDSVSLPGTGEVDRVLRGGSWSDPLDQCTLSTRRKQGWLSMWDNMGFRVVWNLQEGVAKK